MRPFRSIKGFLLLSALMALHVANAQCACAASEKSGPTWVWPLPPERPRVQLIQTVITPQDLGVKKGFFARLWESIVGEDTMERIQSPHGVVADGDGKVYVADWGAGCIHVFDWKKKDYEVFSKTRIGPLLSPIGLALDADGILYASDSAKRRIFVFKKTKNIQVIGDDTLVRPTGIAVNKSEKLLYVVDTGGHRVDVFGLDGGKRFSFGSHGPREGEFNYPTHVAVDARGDVYVMDSLNFRVQIFDKNGKFLAQFGGNGTGIRDFMKPKGIAVDSEGHIWISDSLRNSIQVFDRSGKLLLVFGKLGIEPGQFNLPAGLFIDKNDRLLVADSYNYRVQMFQYLSAH